MSLHTIPLFQILQKSYKIEQDTYRNKHVNYRLEKTSHLQFTIRRLVIHFYTPQFLIGLHASNDFALC